ncbi:MAG: extracellular solute-binding protein [Alphaproteobacteria bacterium]|nr:extracellular solute-binding protein [Alphaproteobacteria bacterium]
MTTLNKGQRSALATVRAAQASRRAILKSATALGAVGLLAPAFSRDARSSSGELNWFTWEDYAPQPLIDRFVADTGIAVNVTTFSSNEDCLNKLKAASGVGWDLTSPSVAWIGAHVENGNLGVLDPAKAASIGNIVPSMMDKAASLGARQGDAWYALPYDWGTEALAYNTEVLQLEYGKASFGDLWAPENAGKMLCRQRSIMLGTGLWMEREGKLPAGTMQKAYDDEEAFDLGYGTAAEFVIANKAQIANWWKGTADTQSGFEQDGAVIGQTWDGPIFQLKNQGRPYNYLAPVEGALMWIDTIALTSGAANIDQAYAFINFAFQPEIGGIVSENTGYNSVVTGFDAFTSDSFKKNFQDAYPGDAIDNLWLQGIERTWFLEKRQGLADKISAA